MKNIWKSTAAIMLALPLAACSGSGSAQTITTTSVPSTTVAAAESTAKAENTAEPVTLTLMHYMAEETKRAGLDAWIKSVTDAHPNITFDVQAVTPWSQYASTLQTKIAAGDAPDIIFGKPTQFSQLIEAGQIMDLSNEKFLETYQSDTLSGVSLNDKVYAVPMDFSISGVFYNKDMFEEYNLVPPKTLSEFNTIIKTFEDHNIVPFVRAYKDNIYPRVDFDSSFSSLVAQNDTSFYSDLQSKKTRIADYPFFKQQVDIYAKRLMSQRDDDLGTDASRANQLFASGKYPMCITGSWAIGDIRTNNPDGNFGFFTTPWSDNADENILPVGIDSAFMVSAQTEHFDTVKLFLEHLASQDGAKQWYENAKVPTVITVETDNLDPIFKDMNDIITSGKTINKDSFPYFSGEFKSKFESELQLFAATPEIGADKFIEKLDKVFEGISN